MNERMNETVCLSFSPPKVISMLKPKEENVVKMKLHYILNKAHISLFNESKRPWTTTEFNRVGCSKKMNLVLLASDGSGFFLDNAPN